MNSILKFQLVDCQVVLDTEDGNIYDIRITKDGYLYEFDGFENEYHIKWNNEEIYLNDEYQDEKDRFIQLFPQIDYVVKHLNTGILTLYKILQQENLTYDRFLILLKETEPSPKSTLEHKQISGIDISYDGNDTIQNLEWRDSRDNQNMNSVGIYDHTTSAEGVHTTIGCTSKYADQMRVFLKYPASILIKALKASKEEFEKHMCILIDFVQDYIKLVSPEKCVQLESLDLSGTGELLCIHSPESDLIDYLDGVPVCTTLVRESLWNSITRIAEKSYSTPHMKFFTDIADLIFRCKIIRELNQSQIDIIEQIKDNKFIDFVIEEIQLLSEDQTSYPGYEDDLKHKIRRLRYEYMDKIPRVTPKKKSYLMKATSEFEDLIDDVEL